MPRRSMLFHLFLACVLTASLAVAADPATPDEAKALAVKAAAHMTAVGPDKAIADFMDPAAGYIDRELFVVVYGPDNTILCGYGVKVLNGKDATTLKDVEGKEFGKDIIALAKGQGSGWVDYRMTNPATKKIALKTSWVIRVNDYVLFVGAFKA
jgi:cytochrome c